MKTGVLKTLIGTLAILAAIGASAANAQCRGDCDRDGAVSVNELITAITIALGKAPATECTPVDSDASATVTVDELITAVNYALTGCDQVQPFRNVQEIFSQSCAFNGCHSAVTRAGGLVLDHEEVSYVNLVDEPGQHPEAVAAGLVRVKSGDTANSFLIRKLRGQAQSARMPLGNPPLSESQIAVIEDWIRRGAHETREECPDVENGSPPSPRAVPRHGQSGQSICDAPPPIGDFVWEPEPPLAPPPAGSGIQIHAPPKAIEPGQEWEYCYAVALDPNELPSRYIRRQVYQMHQGSHHVLFYAYFGAHADQFAEGWWPCGGGACRNPGDCPPDTGERVVIGGSQVAGVDYVVEYPEGAGIPILGDQPVIIINAHYQNPFSPPQPTFGEVWANLEFFEPGEIQVIINGITDIAYDDLVVEPWETRSTSKLWYPRSILDGQPADVAIFELFGHMHKRGISFTIDLVHNDGSEERIYQANAWDDAPIQRYDFPFVSVNRDEALRFTCVHQNGRRGDLTFQPKRCHEDCSACGWNEETQTCIFTRDGSGRVFELGQAMPLVWGELADDEMCNLNGYFLAQSDVPLLEGGDRICTRAEEEITRECSAACADLPHPDYISCTISKCLPRSSEFSSQCLLCALEVNDELRRDPSRPSFAEAETLLEERCGTRTTDPS